MSEWNCCIVKIESVVKHPDADSLDVVTVLGDYPVIVKANEYKPGDIAGYISIDTVVPDTEQFYFLCPKSYKKYEEDGEVKQRQDGMKFELGQVPEKNRIIKAKKIRGVFSMGMLVPALPYLNVGDSIAEAMSLTKWEEEEEDHIVFNRKLSVGAEAAPKGWSIPYYDIVGLRQGSQLFEGKEVVLYEKLHGANAGFCHDGTRLWSKSRNNYKRMDPDDMWWEIAIRYDLENKLSKYPGKVMFGEIYGQVKKFRYDCDIVNGVMDSKIRFFDIWDTETKRWLEDDQLNTIIKELGLDMVPELYRGPWLGKTEMYKFAEGLTMLGGRHIREGFVVRPTTESKDAMFNRLIRKMIGEGYSLQK